MRGPRQISPGTPSGLPEDDQEFDDQDGHLHGRQNQVSHVMRHAVSVRLGALPRTANQKQDVAFRRQIVPILAENDLVGAYFRLDAHLSVRPSPRLPPGALSFTGLNKGAQFCQRANCR